MTELVTVMRPLDEAIALAVLCIEAEGIEVVDGICVDDGICVEAGGLGIDEVNNDTESVLDREATSVLVTLHVEDCGSVCGTAELICVVP